MAKDAQGHGSDGRLSDRLQRFVANANVSAADRAEWMGPALSQGHPKSGIVPIHAGAYGRSQS